MLNTIWLGMILVAVCAACLFGRLDEVNAAAINSAKSAVELCLGLIGIMALWMGMMRLAEASGLVNVLAKILRPVLRRLFSDVPADHPAMGAIVLNMAANMLGLSNAATPLGLRAMQSLEKLNKHPGTATNAMCTFLAINTSSIQLVPATTVAMMAAAGSTQPTAIIGTAFLATCCSTIVAIFSVKFFEKLPCFRLKSLAVEIEKNQENLDIEAENREDEAVKSLEVSPISLVGKILLVAFVGVLIFGFYQVMQSSLLDGKNGIIATVSAISILAVPALLAFFPLYAAVRKVPVYESFVEGAKDGFQVAVRIIPFLVGMLTAIGVLRASGVLDALTRGVGPFLSKVGFPPDLLPLVLMRPLSGSGSNAIFAEMLNTFGPDSMICKMAGTVIGSTETTFYVIAVYFGAVAIKRTRHAIPAGLLADLSGVVAAVLIINLMQ